jgi:hypothetical protein
MIMAKDKKKKPKKTRFVFGRELSEDEMIKALKKKCKEAGMKFIPKKVRPPRGVDPRVLTSITGEGSSTLPGLRPQPAGPR